MARKKPKIHTDDRGHFRWETFFVRGKQKRRKVRVTVIDGEEIDDMDTWLLENADDVFLHQMERWDLIEQRRSGEDSKTDNDLFMKREPVKLSLKISDLEMAFEHAGMVDSAYMDMSCQAFLNRSTGEIVWPGTEDEAEGFWADDNMLRLPDDLNDYGWPSTRLEDFLEWLEDGPVRKALARVRRGKGMFRKYRNVIFESGDVAAKDAWHWFETRRLREQIVQWLEAEGIEPVWEGDIFQPPQRPDKRPDLLRAVLEFVRDARKIEGVRRIALLGSLATEKAIPKDVDLLVEIEDGAPLHSLARRKRRLLGKAMQTGDSCGADVFLRSPGGAYLGRVCGYRKCAPGIRQSCEARNCGRREFLCDDPQNVALDAPTMDNAPLDLWPEVIARGELPEDVVEILVQPLQSDASYPS